MSGKKTKQDAAEQRLKSLKAQNEAAKIALKQRELDIEEREQEFVEPSEFQRAKILTEMLPSKGGSSLGAQAIRMPMSRPKPIYSPNALRTPIASPQEEIEAKQLDMLDELDMVYPEKEANVRTVISEVNDMANRAARLGFDITGGRGYDPTNEAHRELHQEYIKKRDWALSESKKLQEIRTLRTKLTDAIATGKFRGGVDPSAGMTSQDILQSMGGLTLEELPALVDDFNKRAKTVSRQEDYDLFEQDRKAAVEHFLKSAEEIESVNPQAAERFKEAAIALNRTARNLDQEKLWQKKQELDYKKKKDKDEAGADEEAAVSILTPYVLASEGKGGVITDEGRAYSDFNGRYLQDSKSQINNVVVTDDGSVRVYLDKLVKKDIIEKGEDGKDYVVGTEQVYEPSGGFTKFKDMKSFFDKVFDEKDNYKGYKKQDLYTYFQKNKMLGDNKFIPENVISQEDIATGKEQRIEAKRVMETEFPKYKEELKNQIKDLASDPLNFELSAFNDPLGFLSRLWNPKDKTLTSPEGDSIKIKESRYWDEVSFEDKEGEEQTKTAEEMYDYLIDNGYLDEVEIEGTKLSQLKKQFITPLEKKKTTEKEGDSPKVDESSKSETINKESLRKKYNY
jgi:hypothetical protein